MRILRIAVLSLLVVGLAIAQATPASATSCGQQPTVQIKAIGQPIWKPVDFHVFTAAIGSLEGGIDPFLQNMTNLFYPRRHQWCTELAIGPGDPHQPPYTQEMEAGLDIMNFKDSNVFGVADFSPPQGVWLTWMMVPGPGTTGSSPDFQSGPIIPNVLFPIHLEGQTFRNNQLWDPYLAYGDVPALTTNLSCPFNVDGHSHFPYFTAENSSFGPGGPVTGHYQFRITMTDTGGNGWSITANFTVK